VNTLTATGGGSGRSSEPLPEDRAAFDTEEYRAMWAAERRREEERKRVFKEGLFRVSIAGIS
jgi:hypothetical protein